VGKENTFKPGSKFFAGDPPIVVEEGVTFSVVGASSRPGRLLKTPSPGAVPTGEEPGNKIVSEDEFRVLAAKALD
jgi:hypothetical protein